MVKMVFLVVHRSGKSIRPLPANQHPTARNMTWQDTMTVGVLRLLACFCQNWEGRNDVLADFRNEPQRNIPAVGIPEVFNGYRPKQCPSISSTLHCKILPSDGLTCEHPQVSNIGCLQNVCPKLLPGDSSRHTPWRYEIDFEEIFPHHVFRAEISATLTSEAPPVEWMLVHSDTDIKLKEAHRLIKRSAWKLHDLYANQESLSPPMEVA